MPYEGYAILREGTDEVLACGQFAREGASVGLYDVFTHASVRGRGIASLLCERMLSISSKQGARIGYLQVEADNQPALAVYRRLGFDEGYQYHYREQPAA